MKRIAICKYCGESFEYEVKRGRAPGFCCEEHRHLGLNKRTNENQKKHRKCTCKVCGKQYNYVNGKGNGWYCSDECYRLANPVHVCKHCGTEFPHKHNSDNAFCSRECYQEYRKEHPEAFMPETINQLSTEPLRLSYQCVCEYCGKPFETNNIQKRYCSPDCCYKAGIQKAITRQRNIRKSKFTSKKMVCKECGKEFYSEFGTYKSVFCSFDCRIKWNRRQHNRNHRMKVRQVLIDKNITLKAVAERDKNICYLCGRPVDWSDYSIKEDAFLVGPNYPSIDHVYPIAKGGKHEWGNVRLAHCHCNTIKRDNVLQNPGKRPSLCY